MDSQFLDILTIKCIDKKTQSCTKFRFTLECYTTLVRRLQKKKQKTKTKQQNGGSHCSIFDKTLIW